MTKSNPLVSIIIPAYYQNEFLREAIKSSLNQTYEPVEVIVVDDSGERYAEPVATEHDIEYIAHDSNRGCTAGRNTGLDAASGEYILFLDHDDELYDKMLEYNINLISTQGDVGVVYCGINKDGNKVYPDSDMRGDVLERVLQLRMGGCLLPSSMLIDKEVVDSIAPLNSWDGADDVGMKIELARQTQFAFVDKILVDRRIHEDQMDATPKVFASLFDIINDYESLYENHSDRVKYSALYRANRGLGYSLLQRGDWADAIKSCFKAGYYGLRTKRPRDAGVGCALALTSLFGKPGLSFAESIYMSIFPERGKTASGLP